MRPSTKLLISFMVAMAVCLGLGLWIQGRLVVALRKWSREEQTWATLDAQGQKLFPTLRGQRLNGSSDEGVSFDAVRTVQERVPAQERPEVVFVDSQWRVVQASDAMLGDEGGGGSGWRRGDRLGWDASGNGSAWEGSGRGSGSLRNPGGPVRGTVETPSGPRLALACPLDDGTGYAVLYQPAGLTGIEDPSVRYLPAVGAITFVWTLGLQCIAVYLIFCHTQKPVDPKQPSSEEMMMRRTQDLVRTRDAVIFGLAKLAESRDPDTGQHLERIALYSTRLATALRARPEYRKAITPAFVRLIGISSALHDIGKVGIHDSILLKPGPLTPEERARIQEHTSIGGTCLSQIEQRLGRSNFLYMAREIALHHHEHWDGGGYPAGLTGEQIPLAARIVAVADVYDALSSKRVYKGPFPHEQCVRMIEKQSGKQFDPRIVKVFSEIAPQLREIAVRYADSPGAAGTEQRTPADVSAERKQTIGPHAAEDDVWALTDETMDETYVVNYCTAQQDP